MNEKALDENWAHDSTRVQISDGVCSASRLCCKLVERLNGDTSARLSVDYENCENSLMQKFSTFNLCVDFCCYLHTVFYIMMIYDAFVSKSSAFIF